MTAVPDPLPSLDEAVASTRRDLAAADVPAPQALYLMATGAGMLADRLQRVASFDLSGCADVPEDWRPRTLYHGLLADRTVWLIDDVAGEPGAGEAPGWSAGFPCWLASASGARVCVHTSAGASLRSADDGHEGPAAGTLALVRDHINLSGTSPLVALGESRLGPLFPDLSRLHHTGLRECAAERARKLGIATAEVVAACTLGPSMETPAESRWLARAGAQVSVQGLAGPLLASAHAGLAVLSIVAVTAESSASSLEDILEQAQSTAPALEDLAVALGDDVQDLAQTLMEDTA